MAKRRPGKPRARNGNRSPARGGAPHKDAILHKDARALHRAMVELVRVYQLRDRQRVCYYDISVTQCYAIGALLGKGPMGLNALAGALALDKSTTSRAVGSLEERGYVKRSHDPADGRAVRIEVTAKGRRLHDRILDDLYQETLELAEDYDSRARRATAEFIERFTSKAAARFRGESA
jgi:MarR family 2-MHQ and catechol resistance regulon transcriptional repressor